MEENKLHLKDHQVLVNGVSYSYKKQTSDMLYYVVCTLCMFSGTPSLKLFSELLKPFLLQIAILKRFARAKNFFN